MCLNSDDELKTSKEKQLVFSWPSKDADQPKGTKVLSGKRSLHPLLLRSASPTERTDEGTRLPCVPQYEERPDPAWNGTKSQTLTPFYMASATDGTERSLGNRSSPVDYPMVILPVNPRPDDSIIDY